MANEPIIYIFDAGLINAMSFRNSEDKGYLLENMISMYLRQNKYNVEFIRTREFLDYHEYPPLEGGYSLKKIIVNLF